VFGEVSSLALKTPRIGDVVGVHAGKQLAVREMDELIQSRWKPDVPPVV
jgi:hypothetical protein